MKKPREEMIRRLMIAVLRSKNEKQLEKNLQRVFPEQFKVTEVRIILNIQNESFLESPFIKGVSTNLKFELRDGQKDWGMLYIRTLAENIDLVKATVSPILPYITLNIERWHYLTQAQKLKEQWDQVFSSIRFPVAVYDQTQNLIRSNSAFQNLIASGEGLKDQQRYTVTQKKFIIPSGDQFEIRYYRDLQPAIKKSLGSEQENDIALIGGSLAHELNNPIGGILNMIQLIQMENSGNDPSFTEDLQFMEQAARRSQLTIKELLGFVKTELKPTVEELLPLEDILKRSIQIVQVQAQSRGVDLVLSTSKLNAFLHGHREGLVQAFVACLQNCLRRIENKLAQGVYSFSKKIVIDTNSIANSNQIEVTIKDWGSADVSSSSTEEVQEQFYLKTDFLFRYSHGQLLPLEVTPDGNIISVRLRHVTAQTVS